MDKQDAKWLGTAAILGISLIGVQLAIVREEGAAIPDTVPVAQNIIVATSTIEEDAPEPEAKIPCAPAIAAGIVYDPNDCTP